MKLDLDTVDISRDSFRRLCGSVDGYYEDASGNSLELTIHGWFDGEEWRYWKADIYSVALQVAGAEEIFRDVKFLSRGESLWWDDDVAAALEAARVAEMEDANEVR